MCQIISPELVSKIDDRLLSAFNGEKYEINDGDGLHPEVVVESAKFKGMNRVDQHKMVYGALHDLLKSGELHSVNVKTKILE